MSKKSKKKKKKFWQFKVPKITLLVEVVSKEGIKVETNGVETGK